MIEEIREFFRDNYGYINLSELSDLEILAYVNCKHVKDLPFERQMDLLSDYVLANQLADVQE